ncbi:hypothetical protein CBR_g45872 [Chara braunii]|uniref:Uncharacterized protein n=1 Tax=Chara braunii TaxID=69332 RepID=A0A388LZH0_CHABU|nr:hypothetical protein CBR_g45872 [Chara braunii]|eukprot:GBG87718.1 hypothetical protein CBR_g45872 [Chara braunii]
MEKLEMKKREEEEAKAAEEKRLAEQRRIARKEEKLKKEEDDRQLLKKEMLMEISLRMGQLDESLQRGYERDMRERIKGKQKVVVSSSDDEEAGSYESDVESLSRKTEQLVISEKRKRSREKPVGDSPPMETPAKRTPKRRLQLGCRHPPIMKTPSRKTPRKTPVRRKGKIAAVPGTMGKLRYVTDNMRELGNLTEITAGLEGWVNWRGPIPVIERRDVETCLTGEPDVNTKFLDMREVHCLKVRLDGLVITPLDRNPGDTLVLCPKLYFEAMLELFISSTGYVVSDKQEEVVMNAIREELSEAGLMKLAQWDKKGKIGEAYAIPKHKDLARFHPICPTYLEPTIRGCRIVAKVLNHLLYNLPRD